MLIFAYRKMLVIFDKRFSSKILINSSLEKISSSPSGDQPNNAIKLNNASGK